LLLATYGRYTLDDSNPLVGLHCLAASNLLLAGTSSFAELAKFMSLGTTVDPLNNNGFSDFVPPVDDTATQGADDEVDECDKRCNRVRAAKARLALAQLSNVPREIHQATQNLRKAERMGGEKERTNHSLKVSNRFMAVQNSPALMTKLVADFIDGWVRAESERIGALQRAAGKGRY
jgi:hypothetical protein